MLHTSVPTSPVVGCDLVDIIAVAEGKLRFTANLHKFAVTSLIKVAEGCTAPQLDTALRRADDKAGTRGPD